MNFGSRAQLIRVSFFYSAGEGARVCATLGERGLQVRSTGQGWGQVGRRGDLC